MHASTPRTTVRLLLATALALLPLRAEAPRREAAGAGSAVPALPLRFEENRGQSDPRVAYLARGRGWSAFLARGESVLAVRPPGAARAAVLRMRPVGAAAVAPEGRERARGVVHHLRGADPRGWRTNVPTFERVAYDALWPGIDLVYHGDQRRLEYDFVVAPGADPDRIALAIDGAERVAIEYEALVLEVAGGRVVFDAPRLYQERDGAREPVAGRFRLDAAGHVGFAVAAWDATRPLVIDPVLGFSTYLGGSGSEDGFDNMGVAVDATGVYVTGTTDSSDFPIDDDAPQPEKGGFADAFVTKLDPSGTEVLWSTFLGGVELDSGQAIALDSTHAAYVAGFSASPDFPGRSDGGPAPGDFDAFVAKIAPTGAGIDFVRFLGGARLDFALGVDIDAAGNVWLAGDTESADFPTRFALQPAIGGLEFFDAWVAAVSGDDGALLFSSYLGGAAIDSGQDVEVGEDGSVYVAGFTLSNDFPTANAAQPVKAGNVDAFLTKLAPGGSAITYSTYLGGEETDRAIGLAVDAFGNAFVAGDTFSGDFPTTREAFGGFADAFLAKYDAAGALAWSTCLGGDSADVGLAIEADASGNTFLTGNTFSLTFPIKFGFQGERGGDVDAFVAAYDPRGLRRWSSYLGGSDGDRGLGIALDADGAAWVVGDTYSDDFPTLDAPQSARDGIRDAFVTRVPAIEQRLLADPALRVVQVVAGLEEPMAMAFVGEADVLVLEKNGSLRRVTSGVLDPAPLATFAVSDADGGPWGVAVHPAYPASPLVYLLFTAVSGDPPEPVANRVVRGRLEGGTLGDLVTLANLPAGPDHGAEGGTLAFGPDGHLYVSIGDVGSAGRAQNVAAGPAADGSGGVLRLADDGTTPSDNPFVSAGGGFERYAAFGLRGPFAIAFDPVSGALWAADATIDEYDELVRLTPGANGGWSRRVGPTSRAGPATALTPLAGSAYADPALSWRDPIVPRGMVFLPTDVLGEQYRDQLFVGSAADGRLFRLDPDATRTGFDFEGFGPRDRVIDGEGEIAETAFGIGFGSISDLEVGPDGALHVLSASLGQIFRIERRADLDLRLTTTATGAFASGDPVPVRLELSNDTDETQNFGILLTLFSPSGRELSFLGPLVLEIAPRGETSIDDLGVIVPNDAGGGRWQVKGTLFRLDSGAVDLARAEFQVIPEPEAAALGAIACLVLALRARCRRIARADDTSEGDEATYTGTGTRGR
jgi:glucose/arabinose dehydrogenase